jgi:hypothetical protein
LKTEVEHDEDLQLLPDVKLEWVDLRALSLSCLFWWWAIAGFHFVKLMNSWSVETELRNNWEYPAKDD